MSQYNLPKTNLNDTDIEKIKKLFGTTKCDAKERIPVVNDYLVSESELKHLKWKDYKTPVMKMIFEGDCVFCSNDLKEDELKTFLEVKKKWWSEFQDYKRKLNEKLNIDADRPLTWQALNKELFASSSNIDPFNPNNLFNFDVRYIAAVIHHYFPPDLLQYDNQFYFKYPFHLRGLVYFFYSQKICVPVELVPNTDIPESIKLLKDHKEFFDAVDKLEILNKKLTKEQYKKVKQLQTQKELSPEEETELKKLENEGLNDAEKEEKMRLKEVTKQYWHKYYILKYIDKNRKADTTHLQILIEKARYAGLIPYEQVMDYRTPAGIEPDFIDYQRRKTEKEEKFTPSFKVSIELEDKFKPTIEAPLIVVVSEKKDYDYVLEQLARDFKIAFLSGSGQQSITNAYDTYNYIKKYSELGIVLVVSDFDKGGYSITSSFGRKLQYYSSNDTDAKKPSIIIHQFLLDDETINDIVKIASVLELPPFGERTITGEKHATLQLESLVFLLHPKVKEIADLKDKYNNIFTIYDIFTSKLKKLIPVAEFDIESNLTKDVYLIESPLIETTKFKQLSGLAISSVKDTLLNIMQKTFPTKKTDILKEIEITNLTTLDDYLNAMEKHVKSMESYKLLQDAANSPLFTLSPPKVIATDNDKWFSPEMKENLAKLYQLKAKDGELKDIQTQKYIEMLDLKMDNIPITEEETNKAYKDYQRITQNLNQIGKTYEELGKKYFKSKEKAE